VSAYRHQVVEALEALTILSRHRFAWLGEPSPPLPRGIASALPESAARAYLTRRIRMRLYESFYCLGGVGTVGDGSPDVDRWADPGLVAALSAANTGHGSWEQGWRLEERRGDDLLISRDGLRVMARASQCRMAHDGSRLAVALPRELPAWSPGFFTVVGDVNLDPPAHELIARLYFNVDSAGAPTVVSEVTSVLNDARVPFRLKVLDHPGRFGRCDAAVLYLPASDVRRLPVADVAEACAAHLEPKTPVFTEPLAPGIGYGEERGDAAESFGARRCRLLAEAIVTAHEQRNRSLRARLARVERHFGAAGIDLDRPYLERLTRRLAAT
jgi:hypothetical protein